MVTAQHEEVLATLRAQPLDHVLAQKAGPPGNDNFLVFKCHGSVCTFQTRENKQTGPLATDGADASGGALYQVPINQVKPEQPAKKGSGTVVRNFPPGRSGNGACPPFCRLENFSAAERHDAI